VRARGGSPLISPDINIRVRGVHLDRSGLLDQSLLLRGMVSFNQLQKMVRRDTIALSRVEGEGFPAGPPPSVVEFHGLLALEDILVALLQRGAVSYQTAERQRSNPYLNQSDEERPALPGPACGNSQTEVFRTT
jgi:hypothetical protein